MSGAVASFALAAAVPLSFAESHAQSPALPHVPQLPGAPELPGAPDLPSLPDLPNVPGVNVPSPSDVVGGVENTLSSVNGVTGGGGGGGGGTSPSPAQPGAGNPSPPSSPGGDDPRTPTDPTDPGGGSSAPGTAAGSNGGGAARNGSEAGRPAPVPNAPDTPGNRAPAAPPSKASTSPEARDPTFSSRFGDAIASLPSGILIGLLGMGSLALLMTGRSAWFARATDRLKRQRSALREDVGVLQSALVPAIPATIAGSAVSVAYRPAAGPAAGGDFHDVFELDADRIGVVIGDVSGHGPEALPSTAIVRYTIRAYLEAGLEPRAALRLADRALSSSLGGDFATALAAIYDAGSGTLTYACAGQPAPLVAGGHQHENIDALSAPPIGLGRSTGTRQTEISIGGGRIWFFTDGLTEAHGDDGPLLGRDGLEADLADPDIEPAQLLDLIAERAAGADDDMTAMRLEPKGGEAGTLAVETLEVLPGVDGDALREFLTDCGVKAPRTERVVARVGGSASAGGSVVVKVTRRASRILCDVTELPGKRSDRDEADVSASAAAVPFRIEARGAVAQAAP